MTVSLNGEVRARLDAHLDAVERALAAGGSSREQRRGVVDDLEAQILDMLAAKSQTPTVADLEGVLAGLDPPAAYGDSTAGRAAPSVAPATSVARNGAAPAAALPHYSRTAIWGLVLILVSFLPLPLIFVLGMFLVHAQRPAAAIVVTPQQVQISNGGGGMHLEPSGTPELGPPGSTALSVPTTMWASTMPASRSSVGNSFGIDGLCVLVPIFPLALAGTILGWVAFGQIRASRGKLYGKGMALFDGLFYPGLIALLVIVGLIHDLL
jgi:hypothetical protein